MQEPKTKRAALILAISGSLMTPFMGSSINVALPSIGREFHMDAVVMSWVPLSYILTAAALLVPAGRLADIYGRTGVCIAGLFVFTVASLLCMMSGSASTLIASRVCQGLGSAMIFSTGMAILTSAFPADERGKVLGINVAVVYIGLSLGPFVGGLITEHFSWRCIFLLVVPIGVAAIALSWSMVRGERPTAGGEAFDFVGSILYCTSLVSAAYGLSLVPARGSLPAILLGVCGGLAFLRWEGRVKSPVFDLNLFRVNRVFAFSSLAALVHYSATFSVTFLLSIYLQQVKGMGPQEAGLILVVQPVLMAVFSPIAGRLSDRIEPRIVASIGMGLTALGVCCLCALERDSLVGYILSCMALLGIGFAFFSSPNANAIMSSVDKRLYGAASGSVGTMRLLGQILSMSIAASILALMVGRVRVSEAPPELLIRALHWNFAILACLCIPGILLSLSRGDLRGKA